MILVASTDGESTILSTGIIEIISVIQSETRSVELVLPEKAFYKGACFVFGDGGESKTEESVGGDEAPATFVGGEKALVPLERAFSVGEDVGKCPAGK